MKRNIQLVIFDLDGTLADTIPDLAAAMNETAKKYGKFGELEPLVRSSVGRGVYVLFDKVYRQLGIQSEDAGRDVEEFKAYYAEHCFEKSRLYKNTIRVLKTLREKGIHVAVATMKPKNATVTVLEKAGLMSYIEMHLSQEEMEEPKPYPWCVQECARRFGVDVAKTAMVGDGLTDVGAAKAAGALSIAVLGGYFDQEEIKHSGADFIIEDIGQVLDIVL